MVSGSDSRDNKCDTVVELVIIAAQMSRAVVQLAEVSDTDENE